jgi:hypothetical protein
MPDIAQRVRVRRPPAGEDSLYPWARDGQPGPHHPAGRGRNGHCPTKLQSWRRERPRADVPGRLPRRLRDRAHRRDPRGPIGTEIRLGRFAAGPVEWRPSEQNRITVDDVAGTHDRVSTTYKGLAGDARPGDRLLVDDGRVGLRVIEWPAPMWSARSLRAAPSLTIKASRCQA